MNIADEPLAFDADLGPGYFDAVATDAEKERVVERLHDRRLRQT